VKEWEMKKYLIFLLTMGFYCNAWGDDSRPAMTEEDKMLLGGSASLVGNHSFLSESTKQCSKFTPSKLGYYKEIKDNWEQRHLRELQLAYTVVDKLGDRVSVNMVYANTNKLIKLIEQKTPEETQKFCDMMFQSVMAGKMDMINEKQKEYAHFQKIIDSVRQPGQ
jgi:hypothetical protein